MRHLSSVDGLCQWSGRCLAAIGTFDGVHTGHQTILREMVVTARAQQALSAVLTFEPHPQEVLAPDGGPPRLTSAYARAAMIAAHGVDVLVTLPFDRALAAMAPEEFVGRYLAGSFRPQALFVGYNFSFGHRGRGNPELLERLGPQLGFTVRVFAALTGNGGRTVSSTSVREALQGGQVEQASRLLGRPYRLVGEVVAGDRRGRTIGFPTANIDPGSNLLVPGRGVYACWAYVPGTGVFPAVVNSGWRPTFKDASDGARLEAHLIGFDGAIYGRQVEILFISRLRDERPFADRSALAEQISLDIAAAKRSLCPAKPSGN